MSKKRDVLITGGSRGIGLACCQILGNCGFNTICLSRTPPLLALPTNTHIAVDLADPDATSRTVKRVLAEHDISALVCNAGRGDIGSLENFSHTQIHHSIALNLISPLCIARDCIPTFRHCQRSDIVFIGSTSALQGGRYGSVYSAAKFGLRGVAQALSYEVASANCHVGIVQPGSVRTSFFDDLSFEPGPEEAHALDAEDVAEAVKSMLTSSDRAVINELQVRPRQHVVQKRQANSRSD